MKVAGGFLLGILATLIGFVVFRHYVGPIGPAPEEWRYADLVMVLLAAATVAVTCVAVTVGVAAVVGYQSIRRAATKGASDAVKPIAERVAREASERAAAETARRVAISEIRAYIKGIDDERVGNGENSADATEALRSALTKGPTDDDPSA